MKSDTLKIANLPSFDWSRRFDPAYAREYGEAYRAVVGIPPMIGGDDDDDPLTKAEADKIKKAIAEKDKELRAATKENGKLESKVEALTETVEELTEKVDKGDGGDGGGADDKRISKLEERVEKAEAKAEAAEEKREAAEQQSTAIDVATRLNFRNPKRAIKQLDSDDLTDEDSIESALEQLASEEPYMVSTKKQRTVDDTKPKPKSKPAKKAEDDDDKGKGKSGDDDEPTGVARLRKAYGETEGEGEGDEGGDEGGSDD